MIAVQPDERMVIGELLEIRTGDTMVRTKLLEIISDTEYVVLQPTVKGAPLRAKDEDVTFTFYRPNGCCRFSARLHPPFSKGNLTVCRVERVSTITRVQRRQCYRLPIVLDVIIVNEEEEGKDARRCKGKTIDLSESGMALSCFESFEPDTSFIVEIRLSAAETVTVRAKVLRCIKPLRQTDPYNIVLVFTDTHEKAKMLRQYIFMQQVLKRKKNRDKDF